MRILGLMLVAALSLCSCATKQLDTSTAPSVPSARVYVPELLVPSTGKVALTIARDTGFIGGGCIMAVYLDGRVVAGISHGEKVTLNIAPGRHILGSGPNPGGTGLCRIGSDRSRRETELTAVLGQPLKYRLSISANGEFSATPTAF